MRDKLNDLLFALRSKYTIPVISGCVAVLIVSLAITEGYLSQDMEHILVVALAICAVAMVFVDKSNKNAAVKRCNSMVFSAELVRTYEELGFSTSFGETLTYYTNLLIYSPKKSISFGYGRILLSNGKNILEYVYKTPSPVSDWREKSKYKQAIHFTLLLILIDSYHFADIKQPMSTEDRLLFDYLLTKLHMEDFLPFADSFTIRAEREIILKNATDRINLYYY